MAVNKYNDAITRGKPAQEALAEASRGTNQATIALMRSTNGARVETEALTAAQQTSTVASRAAALGFKALSIAGNMILFLAIAKGIQFVVAGIDNMVHATEKAKEAAENARQNFSSLKNEINDINGELNENLKRIKELEEKGPLTYVEDEELQKLKQANDELKLSLDLKDRELKKSAEESLNADRKAFEAEFSFGDFSPETVKNLSQMSDAQFNDQFEYQASLTRHAAIIEKYQVELQQALNDSNGKSAENARKTIETHQKAIEEILTGLGQYKKNIDELSKYKVFDEDEANYAKEVNDALKLAYTYVENGPSTWNQNIFDNIFNSDGIEKTKEELIELAKTGKLDEAIITSYENLYSAIQSGDFILSNGNTALSAFIDQLKATADEAETVSGNIAEIDFSSLENKIQSTIGAQKLFTTALSEQNETGSISTETLSALRNQYDNLGDVLELTASGIQINTTNLSKLTAEERKNTQTRISQTYSELKEHLNETSYILAVYNQRLEQDTTLTEEQRSELEALITAKGQDREATLGQIADLRYLQAEYDNSLSKYNAFKTALSSPDSGTHYDTIQSSLKQVQETWDKGLVGADEIRAFVDYMTSEDMTTASIEDISAAYQQAMIDAKNYFTEGQEGSMRFVKALAKVGMATEDANHKWTINVSDMDEAAKQLGFSVDFVKDNLSKLNDYGFEFAFELDDDGNIDVTEAIDGLNREIDTLREKMRTVAPGFDTTEWEAQIRELEASKKSLEDKIQITIDKQKAIEEIQSLQVEIDKLTESKSKSPTDLAYITWAKGRQGSLAKENNITIEAALNIKNDGDKTEKAIKEIQDLKIEDKEFKISADLTEATKLIDDFSNRQYTATVAVKLKTDGVFAVLQGIAASAAKYSEKQNGASWRGSAFASGSWKVGYTGRALVGELGKELLVRNGQAIPIGVNGAEFVNLQSDDIIFNHAQTERLERNGHINSRGRAFASGSVPAFNSINDSKATGSGGFMNSVGTGYKDISKALKDTEKSSKKTTKELEKQIKEFDWIETALNRISRERSKIADIIDDENVSYEEQLSTLEELLALDEQVIQTNLSALENYRNQWSEIKAEIIAAFGEIEGNALISKIMNGDTSIEGWRNSYEYDSNDKDTAEQMEEKLALIDKGNSIFESLIIQEDDYDKALAQATEDQRKQFEIRINMIKAYLDEVESSMSKAESALKIKETSGRMITEADYKKMINLANEQIDLYYDQIDVLEEELDELEEGSAEWYNIQSQIYACNNAINQCEQNQAEWNEEILNLPIRRIERYLELLNNIKQDMSNKLDEQDALGINATSEQLQSMIDISAKQIAKLQEQHKLLTDKLGNYEYGSDKFNETKNDIQSVEDEVSSLIQSQIEWNKQILQIPLNRLEELSNKLTSVKEALDGITEDYDTAIGAVTQTIDRQVKSIEDLKKATDEAYDAKVKPLRDELDMLNKQNEARKIQLNLEQAAYDLERAKNQKTTQVKFA